MRRYLGTIYICIIVANVMHMHCSPVPHSILSHNTADILPSTCCSCGAGDKVILCYDERYKHYVVFSLSTTAYFVHSDSLAQLGLDQSVPAEQRKSWLLAEVIDKEYCQAKKVV